MPYIYCICTFYSHIFSINGRCVVYRKNEFYVSRFSTRRKDLINSAELIMERNFKREGNTTEKERRKQRDESGDESIPSIFLQNN